MAQSPMEKPCYDVLPPHHPTLPANTVKQILMFNDVKIWNDQTETNARLEQQREMHILVCILDISECLFPKMFLEYKPEICYCSKI